MSDVEGDYDQHMKNTHEQAMQGTRVKVAKIEAARDIKVAKIRSQDYGVIRCFIAFFLLVAVVALCITYGSTRPEAPKTPEQIQSEQERYELCMKVEEKEANC